MKNVIIAAPKTKDRGKAEEVVEFKNTNYLFGRHLYISRQENVDGKGSKLPTAWVPCGLDS